MSDEPIRSATYSSAYRPTDAVTILLELRVTELAAIVAAAGDELVASLLEDVSARMAARLLVKLSRAQAADVLEEMQPDDATDVVEELPPDQVEAILVEMRASEADAIRDLLTYGPETAGGRMTPSFVALAPDLNVDLALAALRAIAANVETMYYAYVTDGGGHLLGVLNLRDLVLAPPGTPIAEIMVRDPVKVRADADQEEAARLLTRHGFLALPVVDADNMLLGIVTADDAMNVLEAEFNEDYLRLAGTDAAAMERRTPAQVARLRLPWLLGTMGIELCAGLVISHFEDVLKRGDFAGVVHARYFRRIGQCRTPGRGHRRARPRYRPRQPAALGRPGAQGASVVVHAVAGMRARARSWSGRVVTARRVRRRHRRGDDLLDAHRWTDGDGYSAAIEATRIRSSGDGRTIRDCLPGRDRFRGVPVACIGAAPVAAVAPTQRLSAGRRNRLAHAKGCTPWKSVNRMASVRLYGQPTAPHTETRETEGATGDER